MIDFIAFFRLMDGDDVRLHFVGAESDAGQENGGAQEWCARPPPNRRWLFAK